MRAGIIAFVKVNNLQIQVKVQKQNRTDVRLLLRNYGTGIAQGKLAQNSTAPYFNTHVINKQTERNCQLYQRHIDTTHRNLSIYAENYSRYSASTIMTSYCKELNLGDYDIIGFDLDSTLLRYNLNEMSPLVYNVLKQYLVQHKGYSSALLQLPLDMDFMQKGLILDGPRGNVLKLSSESEIIRASHGTRMLSCEEIVAAYGTERKWEVATAFCRDPLSTWNGPASKEMRALLDYFDMPSALVFAQAVDLIDQETNQQPKEYTVWADVQAGLIHIYSRDHFSNGISAYFNAMRAEPERYILTTNNRVVSWINQLRSYGKKIFLLTGSNIDFANLTATQAFGRNWQQMFDYVLTFAKKPGFFTNERPFLAVDVAGLRELPDEELSGDTELQPGKIYSQGNWHHLHREMARLLNKDVCDARALYFGDNIVQDIYTPVKHRDFDAVAIAEELLLEKGINEEDYPFREALNSKFWGPYFSVDGKPTLWSAFLSNYAQLSAPSIEMIALCPPSKRIVSKNASGFYPTLPRELETVNMSCWSNTMS